MMHYCAVVMNLSVPQKAENFIDCLNGRFLKDAVPKIFIISVSTLIVGTNVSERKSATAVKMVGMCSHV